MDRSLRLRCAAVLGILAVLPPAAYAAGTPRLAARRMFVPVLIYHHVKWFKPTDDAIERGLTVLPSEFDAELRLLRLARYHVVTAAQLIAGLEVGRPLPEKPVVLTFDDGYQDMFQNVYERLRQAHLTATFFIVPGFLGTPRYLTWRQVQIMAAHGMDIEAHTMTHPDLTGLAPSSVAWQIGESRRQLEGRLHRAVRLMAYPYGAYNRRIEAQVLQAGYHAAFTTQQGWEESTSGRLAEPRVYIDNDDTPAIFMGRLQADSAILSADPT